MSEDLNNILIYLEINKGGAIEKRSKSVLMQYSQQAQKIDDQLSILSRDGYIRSYFHPEIGLTWDHLNLDSDQKIYYSLTQRGLRFLEKGGYENKVKIFLKSNLVQRLIKRLF